MSKILSALICVLAVRHYLVHRVEHGLIFHFNRIFADVV